MVASIESMEQCRRDGIRVVAYSPYTGEEYSADPGDYWDAPAGFTITDCEGTPMELGRMVTIFRPVEELA